MHCSRQILLGTGLRYHLLEWGADDPSLDHTVLLLHGFLDQAFGWESVVAAGLVGRFHLVAPDLRGHGDSDRVGAGGYYHFADYLADVHELVQQVTRRQLSIVGHSMGGSIASYYAGTFPERVARLALLEGLGPPETHDAAPERARRWIAAWHRVRSHAQRSYATVDEAAARLREHDPLLGAELAMRLAETGTAEGAHGRRRFKHDPLHLTPGPQGFHLDTAQQFWRRVRCPTLIVDGALSDFHHSEAEAAARRACLPGASYVVLDGAGHMMMRHQPRALAQLLSDFLAGA